MKRDGSNRIASQFDWSHPVSYCTLYHHANHFYIRSMRGGSRRTRGGRRSGDTWRVPMAGRPQERRQGHLRRHRRRQGPLDYCHALYS